MSLVRNVAAWGRTLVGTILLPIQMAVVIVLVPGTIFICIAIDNARILWYNVISIFLRR